LGLRTDSLSYLFSHNHPELDDEEYTPPMMVPKLPVSNLNELRHYVSETLCRRNELELGAFHVTERLLLRNGMPCGIFFCLHGPRSVKLTAIWEIERNTILFYGSDGQRQQKTQLAAVPELATQLN
jgi:hypothetical protein